MWKWFVYFVAKVPSQSFLFFFIFDIPTYSFILKNVFLVQCLSYTAIIVLLNDTVYDS